jgi:tetratricopeptide (TPR) repeat protein
MPRHRSAAAIALALCGALCTAPSYADDYADAELLYKQGNRAAALSRLEKSLEARPRDARARFLKGVILADQNRTADAIAVFTELTQDFPELPEPHNNLAVLYAGQGDYERAREALEMAIRTHPSYAVAHENLGDVYAQLASRAYDKALQLDRENKTARTKLALIREIVPPQTTNATSAAAAPASTPSAPASSASAQTAPRQPGPGAAPAASAAAAAQPARPAPPTPAAPALTPAEQTQQVLKMVEDWTKAWSNADVDAYLSYYATDFRTPSGEPRARWEAARRKRLTEANRISVTAVSPTVQFSDDTHASVTFRQNYSSDTLKVSGNKTLRLVHERGRWLIQQETVHQ